MVIIFLLSTAIFFFCFILYNTHYIRKRIYNPIFALNTEFTKLQSGQQLDTQSIDAHGEVLEFITNIENLYKEKCDSDRLAATGEIANQVAHDIRSPLAALQVAMSDLSSLPEENRTLIRNAVQRINDITNDLAQKNQSLPDFQNDTLGSNSKAIHLINHLDLIVSEKRTQFRDKNKIQLQFNSLPEHYPLFVKIDPIEFKRMISNILNNAIEALGDQGEVQIIITQDTKKIAINITDNGKGIPKNLIDEVTKKGITMGKKGSGLGLFHAKSTMIQNHGDLHIHSKENHGTTIELQFPICKKSPLVHSTDPY